MACQQALLVHHPLLPLPPLSALSLVLPLAPQAAQEALPPLPALSPVLPLVPQAAQGALPQSQEPLQVHTLLRPCHLAQAVPALACAAAVWVCRQQTARSAGSGRVQAAVWQG